MEEYSKKYRFIHAIPFLILLLVVAYTWLIFFLTNAYLATWRHFLLLILVLINSGLYYTRFRKAILLTGIILLLCTFFLLPPFKDIESSFIVVMGTIYIPWIEYWSFLILITYGCVNFNLLINMYLDWKEEKKQ